MKLIISNIVIWVFIIYIMFCYWNFYFDPEVLIIFVPLFIFLFWRLAIWKNYKKEIDKWKIGHIEPN